MSEADPRFVGYPAEVARRYRACGAWRGDSLWDLLEQRCASSRAAIALCDRRRRLSYGVLREHALALARKLASLGIEPGDAVLVQLPNCATLFEVYFALFRLGARPIAAQMAHRRRELSHFARATAAVAHIYCAPQTSSSSLVGDATEVAADCPSLRLSLGVDPGEPGAGLIEDDRGSDLTLPPAPQASEIALFQLSGGSTNVPKLIARTHDDYLYSVRRSAEVCGFAADTVYLAALPVVHNFPLSSPGALGALQVGGRVVLAEHPSGQRALQLIERERATVTSLVPALVPGWLATARRGRHDLSSLSLLQVGGAKLHPELARRIPHELGCRLQQVFGMAEGLVCYTAPDAPIDEVAYHQGQPMSPLDEIRIVDDLDREVAEGETGHLLARGPYTIRGYYDAREHNGGAFTSGGFYRTGDLVRRLPSGDLVVEGRAKDQINRGGEKIAAPEVEEVLCLHPEVEAAALVGVPDPYLGERSWAFIVAASSTSPAEILRHLRRAGLANYKLPDRIELCASLPKTPVGKIDKRALCASAAQRSEPAGDRK